MITANLTLFFPFHISTGTTVCCSGYSRSCIMCVWIILSHLGDYCGNVCMKFCGLNPGLWHLSAILLAKFQFI